MYKLIDITYRCSSCDEVWTMHSSRIVTSPWCPFCGRNDTLENDTLENDTAETITIQKSKKILEQEDFRTETKCKDGWWNPIKQECMGSGTGFKLNKD